MFFVSVAKCVCVCVGVRGYKEARCIFRGIEEPTEIENKVFKFLCLCFGRDVEGKDQGQSVCPVRYLRSVLRPAFQHSD